jgi:uncharacterized protein (TIGR02145 family)
MKKILLFLILIPWLVSPAQVTVTLQSKYLGNLLNLDSIIVENLTQPGRLSLVAPPEINSYMIDLMQGHIINDIPEIANSGIGLYECINSPGRLQVSATLINQEIISVSLFTVMGEFVRQWDIECGSGVNLIDLSVGSEQMYICTIAGKEIIGSFKIVGKDNNTIELTIIHGIKSENRNNTPYKSRPDFTFTPGNGVRFTAYKNGMYRNSITCNPQNLDSVLIYLSMPCPGTPVVTDYDGNSYSTVLINNQCWMRENLRSKHYADGTSLVDGTGAGDITGDDTTKYWFDYDDNPEFSAVYGRYYTGAAMINGAYGSTGNIQGVCPNDWHVSSASEWCEMEQLFDYTVTDCSFNIGHDPYGYTIGDKLKETDTIHWPPVESSATDEIGFKGLPGGNRGLYQFGGLRSNGIWWAWDPQLGTGPGNQQMRKLTWYSGGIYREMFFTFVGFSVRCVKNQE